MTKASEPAWLAAARAKLGTREAPGPANSATIMGWAKRLGTKILGMAYNADSVPWCGVFVAACIQEAGLTPAPIAVRAKSWAAWGARLQFGRLAPGAVLVFQREGGGHVGFYVGEDKKHYMVLGGNQGNKVSIVAIEKERLVACRWPVGAKITTTALATTLNGPVSKNEA